LQRPGALIDVMDALPRELRKRGRAYITGPAAARLIWGIGAISGLGGASQRRHIADK